MRGMRKENYAASCWNQSSALRKGGRPVLTDSASKFRLTICVSVSESQPILAGPDLWSAIQPETLWQGRTGKGVRVAVVDSGIDTEHPDLKGKVKQSVEIQRVDGHFEFLPSTSGDQAGHGTACAGIIT